MRRLQTCYACGGAGWNAATGEPCRPCHTTGLLGGVETPRELRGRPLDPEPVAEEPEHRPRPRYRDHEP